MFITKKHLSRRTLLRGAGIALALPLLDSMIPAFAPAAATKPVRRLGVVVVPEGHRVLTELTVEENLRVAGTALNRRELDEAVERALDTFPELKARLGTRAGALSGGQQQMLVLGQAIVSQPRYILADELSFGLAPVVVARLVPVLEAFAAKGIGVLLIEQFTHIALRIAHHAYVMERGRICFSGAPEALLKNPDILHSAYLAG